MCGIFGILGDADSGLSPGLLNKSIKRLFIYSESRGKESSGIVVRGGMSIDVLKEPLDAHKLIKLPAYKEIFSKHFRHQNLTNKSISIPFAIMGHSRLVTNGPGELNSNNQPVIKDGAAGIHNGIIVNDKELWGRFPQLTREYDVDTEVFLSILQYFHRQNGSLISAVKKTYQNIKGSASVSVLFSDSDLVLLATNNGSLYFCESHNGHLLVFASEKYILTRLINNKSLKQIFDQDNVSHVKAGSGYIINVANMDKELFTLDSVVHPDGLTSPACNTIHDIKDWSPNIVSNITMIPRSLSQDVKNTMMRTWENIYSHQVNLKRCTICLMPTTVPFIRFDKDGVCNYCRNYETRGTIKLKGQDALEQLIARYRSSGGQPDCIVGFSGGRDSSYGLDYVKNVLKMNPIAFTYDWGMLTDLGRRNQSKVSGDLGVENILVSANIKQKRKNIQRNLHAWLKNPQLGMVPILMVGDKQFYYYFHEIRRQTGAKLFIFTGGHEIEETPFKFGFAGVRHGTDNVMNRLTGISFSDKIKLLSYYAFNYLRNPSYINPSIFDTLFAYYCTYMLPDDYLYLFHYIEWDENKVISTIRNKFDWELANDTIATWRIDDGTVPFYNYIYLTVAGFTEFDNFRSSQIREGKITRAQGLELIQEENKPRFEAIEWYSNAVDFDCNQAISIINSIPKLYCPAIAH